MNDLPTIFDRPLIRSPLKDLKNMQRQMDRIFDQMWSGGAPDLDGDGVATPTFAPSCDIAESDTHYLMTFDLPGVKTEDVKIDLRDTTLTVSGARKEEREESKWGQYRAERFYGNFERSFTLPRNVKADQIEANYADGVLRVAVPKAETTQAKRITIGHKKEDAKKFPSH